MIQSEGATIDLDVNNLMIYFYYVFISVSTPNKTPENNETGNYNKYACYVYPNSRKPLK